MERNVILKWAIQNVVDVAASQPSANVPPFASAQCADGPSPQRSPGTDVFGQPKTPSKPKSAQSSSRNVQKQVFFVEKKRNNNDSSNNNNHNHNHHPTSIMSSLEAPLHGHQKHRLSRFPLWRLEVAVSNSMLKWDEMMAKVFNKINNKQLL